MGVSLPQKNMDTQQGIFKTAAKRGVMGFRVEGGFRNIRFLGPCNFHLECSYKFLAGSTGILYMKIMQGLSSLIPYEEPVSSVVKQ